MSSTHRCEPAGGLVVFARYCRTCHEEIEPVFCMPCEATGHDCTRLHSDQPCRHCAGTGVVEWRKVPEDLKKLEQLR